MGWKKKFSSFLNLSLPGPAHPPPVVITVIVAVLVLHVGGGSQLQVFVQNPSRLTFRHLGPPFNASHSFTNPREVSNAPFSMSPSLFNPGGPASCLL